MPDIMRSRGTLAATVACLGTLLAPSTRAATPPSPAELLAQVRATYTALRSYSDEAVITTEYRSGPGPMVTDRHSYRTRFQVPRSFILDYEKAPQPGGERYVLWGDDVAFHTWWSATKVTSDYGKGRGATAFAVSAFPTNDAATLVPSLLFAASGLQGLVSGFTPTRLDADENVGGQPCYTLRGHFALAYGSGNVAGARPVTLWIDRRTLLLRQVLEDTPDSSGTAVVLRVRFALSPVANPVLSAADLSFKPPP